MTYVKLAAGTLLASVFNAVVALLALGSGRGVAARSPSARG